MSQTVLHHERAGAGRPAIVLVHGLCCAGEDWAGQVAALGGRYETLTVDLRGHGRSDGFTDGFDATTSAADVVALARRLGLGPAIVVGHSMGCRVAVEAARSAPDVFRGAVLVDGSVLAPDSARAGAPLPAVDFAAVRGALFDQMFVESSDPATRQAIVERAAAVPVAIGQSFHDAMVVYDATSMEAALAEIDAPITVVQSTYMNPERRRVPVEPGMRVPWLELVQRVARDPRIEIVAGVGHFTMLEAPAAVNEAIEAMAARLAV